MDYLTATQAAKELGVTTGRIRQMAIAGTLKAQKVGRDWLIKPNDLEAVRERPQGRPRKMEGKR